MFCGWFREFGNKAHMLGGETRLTHPIWKKRYVFKCPPHIAVPVRWSVCPGKLRYLYRPIWLWVKTRKPWSSWPPKMHRIECNLNRQRGRLTYQGITAWGFDRTSPRRMIDTSEWWWELTLWRTHQMKVEHDPFDDHFPLRTGGKLQKIHVKSTSMWGVHQSGGRCSLEISCSKALGDPNMRGKSCWPQYHTANLHNVHSSKQGGEWTVFELFTPPEQHHCDMCFQYLSSDLKIQYPW